LKTILSKYLDGENDKDTPYKVKEYNWEFIDTLVDAGILLFRNRNTG